MRGVAEGTRTELEDLLEHMERYRAVTLQVLVVGAVCFAGSRMLGAGLVASFADEGFLAFARGDERAVGALVDQLEPVAHQLDLGVQA